ncbi:hypothetical protein ANO11243_021560 [Dothideomycetidae sp. 11243]|nr:hypothetical protein ANO11243_021560 [fungal sp. No.11243]
MAVDAEWARDGKSHDSGSVISGLSSVDDDTDEFGRMLVRHVRDEQRLTSTINGNGQAFRKARSNPRISAALDQLNDTPGRRLLSSGASDPGVVEHALASPSPPLNIPRDWGRKARQNNDWLRRLGTDDTGTRRPLSANAVATLTRPTHDDDHEFVDWAGAAAQPVRSVEEETPTSSEKRHVIHSHSPGRKLRANDSIDRIRQWETEQDFTAGSIIQSTPPFLSRNNRIQELERIQGRAIATDRLSRISERDTPQSVKDRLESRLSRTSAQPLIRRRKTSPNEKLLNDPHARSSNMGNDASGRHELDRKSSMPTVVSASQVVSRGAGERPANGRNDSLQLLKRLARVTSQSSSPSANDKPVLESDYARAQAETTKRFKRQSSAQAPEVVPSTGMDQVQATPRVPVALSAKTPKVMGAWVDTPHTVRHDSAHPPSPKVHKEVKLPPVMSSEQSKELLPEQSLLQRALSAPSQSRPPSALHNLLHPIESSPKKELNVGDETLASLEGLLDPTATLTELSATLNLEDLRAQIATLHSSGRPLSKADNERRDELLAIEAMSERLRAARKGVREVGRGLRNVERQVDDFADNTGKSFGRGGRCERGLLQATLCLFDERLWCRSQCATLPFCAANSHIRTGTLDLAAIALASIEPRLSDVDLPLYPIRRGGRPSFSIGENNCSIHDSGSSPRTLSSDPPGQIPASNLRTTRGLSAASLARRQSRDNGQRQRYPRQAAFRLCQAVVLDGESSRVECAGAGGRYIGRFLDRDRGRP